MWIFTGSLTVTLASVSAIGAALALAYFTCEHHYDDDDDDDDDDGDDDNDDGDDDDDDADGSQRVKSIYHNGF